MNEFKFFGKAVEKPELIESEKGYKYCNVLIEVKRSYKNNAGEALSDVFKVTCFKTLAEDIANNVKKGTEMIIDGRITADNFEKDNGSTYYHSEFVGEKIYCID